VSTNLVLWAKNAINMFDIFRIGFFLVKINLNNSKSYLIKGKSLKFLNKAIIQKSFVVHHI
jgi:hypothetical protein